MKSTKSKIIVASLLVLIAIGYGGYSFMFPAPGEKVTLGGTTYSIKTSTVGALVDFDESRALLDKHLPGITSIRQLNVARPLTLIDIQPYYPALISDAQLAALEAELETVEGASVEVYTTGSTLVGVILDDPEARVIVDRYLPGFSEHPDIGQGRGFTLSFMQKFQRDVMTDEVLANINADFEALAKSRAGLK